MTTLEKNREDTECNFRDELLAERLAELMPAGRVKKIGYLVYVFLTEATFSIHQVADGVFDLSGKLTTTAGEESIDQQGISQDRLEYILLTAYENENPTKKPSDALPQASEQTDAGGVSQYNPAKAFARPEQRVNRATEQSKREGWQRIGEASDQVDVSAQRMAGHSLGWLVEYLNEMLPADSIEMDGGKIVVKSSLAKIEVEPRDNGTYCVRNFVAEEPISERDNVPTGDLLKYLHEITSRIDETRATYDQKNSPEDYEEITPSDVFGTLRELAEENGNPTDPIRNPSLFDLRGLILSPKPFAPQKGKGIGSLLEELDAYLEGKKKKQCPETPTLELEQSASVRGDTMKDGHPVSVNENRDASRPYADTLGGKVLRWVQGHGAVLVNKSDLPPEKFLSWDDSNGVVLTEGKENIRRPSWYFSGWKK
ncbi:MAG: hypothetical protein KJ072_06070 [Verrucomicrobia bacterium]|nr:hypothetical protein [Verrucomicrobiota bacterium]